MYAYKTNSADYLDYVASLKTREEILADPDLCPLLENPYIKDNMEIALLWNKAKYGDYQDKYNFLEYLMCNGPELDADTILHYRMKAYNDPVCMEIAYSYLSDTQYISEVRQKKYEKETDDCFKNPCFYMGKFSAMMGSCGDVKDTKSAFNIVANWAEKISKDKEEQHKQQKDQKQGKDGDAPKEKDKDEDEPKEKDKDEDAPQGSNDTVEPKDMPEDGNPQNCFVVGCRWVWQNLIPQAMQKGIKMMGAQIMENNKQFTDEMMKNYNTAANAKHIGDWLATPVSEMLDLVTKANVRRQLGDCARLWSHVRRLRLFTSDNHYGPIRADQIITKTNTDGTPQQPVAKPQPDTNDASKATKVHKNMKQASKANQKILKWLKNAKQGQQLYDEGIVYIKTKTGFTVDAMQNIKDYSSSNTTGYILDDKILKVRNKAKNDSSSLVKTSYYDSKKKAFEQVKKDIQKNNSKK